MYENYIAGKCLTYPNGIEASFGGVERNVIKLFYVLFFKNFGFLICSFFHVFCIFFKRHFLGLLSFVDCHIWTKRNSVHIQKKTLVCGNADKSYANFKPF